MFYKGQPTVLVRGMPHRKWRESKQQLSCAPSYFARLGCCLVSLHCLWDIPHTSTVYLGSYFAQDTILVQFNLRDSDSAKNSNFPNIKH